MDDLVAFYRVSGKSQEGNTSLDDQRKRVRYWAEAIGGSRLCLEIEAVETATRLASERKKFKEAIEAAQHCAGLIVYSIDRFFRNAEEGLKCAREHFLEKGKKLIFLNENLDISSDDGWVMFGMLLLMAEKEARTSKRRMNSGKKHKSEAHCLAYINGAQPYGYSSTGNRGSRMLIIEPNEYPWRKQIFAWSEEGKSHRWISDELNRIGVPTKRGRKWRDTTIRILLERPLALEALLPDANSSTNGNPSGKPKETAEIPDGKRRGKAQSFAKVKNGRSRHKEYG